MYLDTGLDGLGKFSLKKSLKKVTKAVKKVALLPVTATKYGIIKPLQRSKTLRKVALIGTAGAALYFGGPLVKAAASKLMSGGKTAAPAIASGSSADYAPEPEYGDTTGYEGQSAATIPQTQVFTPNLFSTAEQAVKTAARLTALRKPSTSNAAPSYDSTDEGGQQSQPASTSIMPSMNTGLMIGAGVGLVALVLMMRKK